ncbi:hypothetical protein [Marivita sp.]
MMARVAQFLRAAKRAEARISDSLLGDAIGAICVMLIGYGIMIAAWVLQ